jgi:4-amino-4-deoxy-L-arabinose transferase-like glycosyltransferase
MTVRRSGLLAGMLLAVGNFFGAELGSLLRRLAAAVGETEVVRTAPTAADFATTEVADGTTPRVQAGRETMAQRRKRIEPAVTALLILLHIENLPGLWRKSYHQSIAFSTALVNCCGRVEEIACPRRNILYTLRR